MVSRDNSLTAVWNDLEIRKKRSMPKTIYTLVNYLPQKIVLSSIGKFIRPGSATNDNENQEIRHGRLLTLYTAQRRVLDLHRQVLNNRRRRFKLPTEVFFI